MTKQKRPPLEMDDLTTNLKQSSGQGIDAFFPSLPAQQQTPTQDAKRTSDSPTAPATHSQQKQPGAAAPRTHDVTPSSRQDVNLRKWRDIIEDTETHNSALRITNEERYAVEDLVSELRRKYKIKTSMNELARLGLLYIIQDFNKYKQQRSLLKSRSRDVVTS